MWCKDSLKKFAAMKYDRCVQLMQGGPVVSDDGTGICVCGVRFKPPKRVSANPNNSFLLLNATIEL